MNPSKTKEPPDKSNIGPYKYQSIKMPLQKILKKGKEKITMDIINDAVIRTNHITTKAYLLLRLWVLDKYHQDVHIPEITEDTIKMAIKSIIKKSTGPPPKKEKLVLFNEFKQLHDWPLENGKYLATIMNYYSTTILTAIENNIKMHFMDYVKRFVNSYFKTIHKDQMTDSVFKKQLYKELLSVKNDIINNTLTCDDKYHPWLTEHRHHIIPKDYDTSYYYDLKVNPQRYLKHMIYMNLQLEENEAKLFQFFPLQTQIIPRHIEIDTMAIVDLFIRTGRQQYNDHLTDHQKELWKSHFNIKPHLRLRKRRHNRKDRQKRKEQNMHPYRFDYAIITDGYSVSLRFLHTDFTEHKRQQLQLASQGRKRLKGLTSEQKEHQRQEKLVKQKRIQADTKQKRLLENQRQKDLGIKDIKPEPKHDFLYIDEVPQVDLQGKHVFIDPGKRTLLTMMDDNGKFCSYTNRQRISSTKRLKYQSLLKNYKDKLGMTTKENTLSEFNSKTCRLDAFKNYITQKVKVNTDLYSQYEHTKFRQYRLYSYINTQRTEDNMLNLIANQFGKDVKIIMGDWSVGKQMRNFISTPNLTIKRKLKTRFPVYNLDEFRTSCLHYKTEGFCKNLYLPDHNNVIRKQHSILTYQMENQRKGCLNRDKNGCKNMQKIFNSYMETGLRPEKYRRDYKFQENIPTIPVVGLSNGIMPQVGALQAPLGRKIKVIIKLKVNKIH